MKKTILAASLALIISPVFADGYANGPMSVNLSSAGGATSSAVVTGTGSAAAGATYNSSSFGSAGNHSQYQSYNASASYQDQNYYYYYGGGNITLYFDTPFGDMTVTGTSDDDYNYYQYLSGNFSVSQRDDKAWADGGQQMNVDTFANAEHNGDGIADANAKAGGYNNVSVQNGDAYYNSPE